MKTASELWDRYRRYVSIAESIDLTLDISRMSFEPDFFDKMEPDMQKAYRAMDELERGAIANPDENRMVGHYWLRAPRLAPSAEIAAEIEDTLQAIREFAAAVHEGAIQPESKPRFTHVLCVGIGGSALGPMFVADALGDPRSDRMAVAFIDNTDPDGIARVLSRVGDRLAETLCVIASKSGGTPETRNGMLLLEDAYRRSGLSFARHAAAVTMPGSRLDLQADSEHWLKRFPMFDWIGGRTSELSAVGLLPAALQGLDIDAVLAGAAACDAVTRVHDTKANPAAALALMWFHATGGKGLKDMVVLPYKDRLLLLSRYLQQLVMESLGKRLDLDGNLVEQGIAVYGNKGSTDQHAYVQQLRDGVNNFFVTFIRVLESGGAGIEVEPGVTAGDYLQGFLLGTREALYANGRESLTLSIRRVDARSIGTLIALFERAVGLYASLIHVNAYHQPGVEAGKKAASAVLDWQARLLRALSDAPQRADEIASAAGDPSGVETAYLILEHLAADNRVKAVQGGGPGVATFSRV